MKKDKLKKYHNFIKNSKVYMCFVSNNFLDVVFDLLSYTFGNCFYILEIKNVRDVYMRYQEEIPIFFIDNHINETIFMNKTIYSAIENNELSNDFQYFHYAFLFKCLVYTEKSESAIDADFSDLLYLLNPYIFGKFGIYNAPYVRNRKGYVKWLQDYYILKEIKSFKNNRIAFMPGYMGNGEALIGLPIINEFVNRNKETDIYIYSWSRNIYDILKKCFPECQHKHAIKNEKLSTYLENIFDKYEYQTIYSQFAKTREFNRNKHRIDVFAGICDIHENIALIINRFDMKKIMSPIYNMDMVNLFNSMRERKYRYIIATQFFTNTSKERCLDIHLIHKLAKLCIELNIGIANLSVPNENLNELSSVSLLDNFNDFSKFSLLDLSYVIEQSDIYLGIDSSFGHLAGLLNKPSITLWLNDSPSIFQSFPISYRVIRNNYSFCLKNKGDDCIDIILKKINEIWGGEYILKKEFITYNDSVNMVDSAEI